MAIQSDWHDTIVTIFSACKDLQIRGDIEEGLFELTNWKLEYSIKKLFNLILNTAYTINSRVICRPCCKLPEIAI